MKLRSQLLGVVVIGIALLGRSGSAGALLAPEDLVPDPATADICEPFEDGARLVCLNIDPGDPENYVAPSATACVFDDNLNKVFWWYGGVGKLGCAQTYHWAWLGTPGACAGTGATGDPTVCVGRDEGGPQQVNDGGGAGASGPLKHCLVWVAGSSFCFYD